MNKTVTIGSLNPVKINATKKAFTKMLPEYNLKFIGDDAPSDIPDQPFGDEQTLTGARNRIAHLKNKFPDADYWVAIEGGVKYLDLTNKLESFAWIVIEGNNSLDEQLSRSASFIVPTKMSELVSEGFEMGHAADKIFGTDNCKQKEGAIGLLTKNNITREELYIPSIIFALIPFLNKDIYTK